LPLVYRDVIEFYRAYVQGRAAVLPVAPAYERYIAWLLDSDVERARDHWHGVLKEIDAPTPLVIDRLPHLFARVHEHDDVLHAIANGDATRASDILVEHITTFEREIRNVL
jgi:DNA-binding GntR family transcriptional regulator